MSDSIMEWPGLLDMVNSKVLKAVIAERERCLAAMFYNRVWEGRDAYDDAVKAIMEPTDDLP